MNTNLNKIWLSSPHMGGNELKYIQEAFEQNWIAPLGPNVDGFEKDLEKYLNNGNVVALSSGTAAIHLALIMLGIKPDDYVLVSSFTFSATVNPIVYQRANPILIDSEPDTWNMDPQLLEEAILDCQSKNIFPKAIILVHLYGMPAKLDEISDISKKYNIPIIEDAAEALGSEYKGQKLGTFGDFGILSFNGNKIITTSGGGALICKTEEQADFARFLATQARDNAPHYQHSHIGYNYRMSNIIAGIGRGQMEVIGLRVQQRREMNNFYHTILNKIEGVEFLAEPSSIFFSNYWLTTIIINPKIARKDREFLRLAFEKATIESRPLWKPMHLQPIYEKCLYYGNGISDKLFAKGICLPSGTNLTSSEKDRIIDVLINVFK